MTTRPCPEMEGRLVDLALGHLAGDEHQQVMSHLERCAACSAELASLCSAGDDLLVVAPLAEPPPGFEERVFARLGLMRRGSLRRRLLQNGRSLSPARAGGWRVATTAAAALVALAGVGLGGYSLGRSQSPSVASSTPTSGALMASGHAVGRVMLYPGRTTWLFMYLDRGTWAGSLECQVVGNGGRVMTVGSFWATGGTAAWDARVPMQADEVREAMVVAPSGRVMAVARIA